jgi:hypothetical protein
MGLKPEQVIQVNLINWFNSEFPELADDLHHFANERKCSQAEGRLLKRMGVKKGVADLFLALPTFWLNSESKYYFHGLWLELKTEEGRLTGEQFDFLQRKRERGFLAVCTKGFEAAKQTILVYLHGYIADKDKTKQKISTENIKDFTNNLNCS